MMYTPSTRNVRGNGAMKKGHRNNGEMWINIRRSYAGFSRGSYFNENMTIGELVDAAAREVMMEEGFQNFPADWYIEVQSHRKALDPDSTITLNEVFDGVETIHAKVYNEDGHLMDFDGQRWYFH
ncbi:hypothetical protein HWV62_10633 [Athelia sp. TMB]|nr:hypothetical protein HWV62_10633 [Athelia sp. TMB]